MSLIYIGGREWLEWPFQPEVILPLLLVQGAYLYAVSQLRPHISDAGKVSRRQVALFSSGMLVLYLATGSIIDHLADNFLLSAHALELVMITLVAPPISGRCSGPRRSRPTWPWPLPSGRPWWPRRCSPTERRRHCLSAKASEQTGCRHGKARSSRHRRACLPAGPPRRNRCFDKTLSGRR